MWNGCSLGHICHEADDGESAIEAVRIADCPYDIVLMDNQMSRMTGAVATRIIRHSMGFHGIILGVTGNAMQDDIKDFIESGADDVIIKPLDAKSFKLALAKIRQRRGNLQTLPDAVVERS